jgi:tRNA A-37 threonylcarbamoyl transferase component Bud32
MNEYADQLLARLKAGLSLKEAVPSHEVKHDFTELEKIAEIVTDPIPGVADADATFPVVDAHFPTLGSAAELKNLTVRRPRDFKHLSIEEADQARAAGEVVHLFTSKNGRGSREKCPVVINDRQFNYLYIKGNTSLSSFKETNSHFSRKDSRFQNFKLKGRAASGLASGYQPRWVAEDDAINSQKLDSMEVRTRLPVVGYLYEQFDVDGVTYTPEEFTQQFAESNMNEAPAVLVFAIRAPFSIADIHIEAEEALKKNNVAGLEFMMSELVECAKVDEHPLVQETVQKAEAILAENQGDNLTPLTIIRLLNAFNILNCLLMGDGFGKIHNAGLVHDNPHTQNISALGEITDLGTMYHNMDGQGASVKLATELYMIKDHFTQMQYYSDQLIQRYLTPDEAEQVTNPGSDVYEQLFLRTYKEKAKKVLKGYSDIGSYWAANAGAKKSKHNT